MSATEKEPYWIGLKINAVFECVHGHRFEKTVHREHGVLIANEQFCLTCGFGGRLISARRVGGTL